MASSIVKSAAQQLGNLLVEEAKTLYKVRDKIESLQVEMAWMECFLRDADSKQHQERVVCMWLSQIRDLAYDAEDIIQKYVHNDSRYHRQNGIKNTLKWFSCIICTCDAWTLHNLGSDIDTLTIRISELTSRLRTYGIQIISPTRSLEYNAMMREERRTYSYTKEDVVGFDADIKKVVSWLLNADVTVVGVSGTGGLGKSTLARKVLNDEDIKNRFNTNCVWVYVSKEFSSESIFQEIFLGLGNENFKKDKESEHENEEWVKKKSKSPPKGEQLENEEGVKKKSKSLPKGEQLVGEIHKLLQVNKCLIVLDDIWRGDHWERLKPAFESIRMTSSKLLLTTRNQNLLNHVHLPRRLHLQQPLSLDNSWELLRLKTFDIYEKDYNHMKLEVEMKSKMEKLGREMLNHCDGLPIAIVALGGILSAKMTLSQWEYVQKNISSYLISSNNEQEGRGNSRLLEVLELSYDELPFYLKPCFLYLGYFPEDYKISTQKLFHLWEAEGLLLREGEAMTERETSYDIGERYLNELVQRSMVEVEERHDNGRIKTCRVHDVMRDMCLRKCEEVGFLNHIQCTKSDVASTLHMLSIQNKKIRRCALHDPKGDFTEKHFESGGKAIGIRSVLVFGSQISQKIWTSFPLVRVLDLEGVDVGSIAGVGHLIHLRYLSLKDSRIIEEVLPSCIYDLKYLETLDLRTKSFVVLENMFDKMKKLRHLYLPWFFSIQRDEILSFPVGQMETLENVNRSKCDMGVVMQMEKLRVFSVNRGNKLEDEEAVKKAVAAPIIKNPGQLINSFHLHTTVQVINKLSPETLRSLAHCPSFNKLEINGDDQGIHTLLGIDIFVKSLTWVEMVRCELRKEDVSALEKLPDLKYLFFSGSLEDSFPKLSFSANSFPKLTQLGLYVQTEFNEWEVGDGALPTEFNEWEVGDGALPTLKSLRISGSENLKSLSNIPNSLTDIYISGFNPVFFIDLEKLPRLQQLEINKANCDKISFSPGSFPHLTQFSLGNSTQIHKLEFGVEAVGNLQGLILSGCKSLNTLKNLPYSLTQVELHDCKFRETELLLLTLEKIPCLQQLVLQDSFQGQECIKMSFSPRSFLQLTHLTIYNAPELVEWEVGDGALPKLQHLEVKLIDMLMEIPSRVLSNLLCLKLTRWKELKELPSGATPNLQSLLLYGCEKLRELPTSLPADINIECDPCIKGIEKYKTCPFFTPTNRFNPIKYLRLP